MESEAAAKITYGAHGKYATSDQEPVPVRGDERASDGFRRHGMAASGGGALDGGDGRPRRACDPRAPCAGRPERGGLPGDHTCRAEHGGQILSALRHTAILTSRPDVAPNRRRTSAAAGRAAEDLGTAPPAPPYASTSPAEAKSRPPRVRGRREPALPCRRFPPGAPAATSTTRQRTPHSSIRRDSFSGVKELVGKIDAFANPLQQTDAAVRPDRRRRLHPRQDQANSLSYFRDAALGRAGLPPAPPVGGEMSGDSRKAAIPAHFVPSGMMPH